MLRYKTHIQNRGWGEWMQEGRFSGTTDQALRLEAIIIEGVDDYRVYMENSGWGPWVKAGEVAGSEGQGLRIEAIEIHGEDLNYQVHVQNIGWMDFSTSGETAGTTGDSLRVEAIRILRAPEPLRIDDARSNYHAAPKPIPVPVAVASTPAPDQPKKSGKIYLAVGHGTQSNGVWDPGCVDGDYTEAELMLAIGKVAAAKLRNMGFDVNTDSDTGNDKNIAVGVALANSWGADVYVSLDRKSVV